MGVASGESGVEAHVEEEELEEALVREDVEHVAGGAVDDRQPVHAVLDQHAHRLQQRLVRRDRDERLVARQRVCTQATATTECTCNYSNRHRHRHATARHRVS